MRGLLVVGALAALGLAGAAGAQDAEQERTATVAAGTAGGDVVRVGDVEYELPAGEVLASCVDGRTDDLDGSRLLMRPFFNTAGEGWLALPAYPAWANGRLADARQGDCFALDPEAVNR